MKNMINTIKSKALTAQIRAAEALNNDKGMEVVQFLAVALLSITIGAALVSGLSGTLSTTITQAAARLRTLFDFTAG